MFKKSLFLLATTLFLTSCSTVVNGVGQNLKLKAKNNQRVVVYDENNNVVKEGHGEVDVYLKKASSAFRGATYTIKSGDKTLKVNPHVNIGAFVVGNFFSGGAIGWIIDGATGAMYDLKVDGEYKKVVEF